MSTVLDEWAKLHGIGLNEISTDIKEMLDNAVVCAHMVGFTSITIQNHKQLDEMKDDLEFQELIDLLDGACWRVSRSPECTRIYFGSDLNLAFRINFEKRCKIGT